MSIKYKINILDALKSAGVSTYRIQKGKIFGNSTLTRLKRGEPVSWENISTICKLLNCQPGDIMEYVPEEE